MQKVAKDIDDLMADTCKMADLAVNMLERAVKAIIDGDADMAGSIIADQDKIEKMDDTIEETAIRILSLYQPTAGDARAVAAVLKSITHLERIAKYSTNIATGTRYLADKPRYDVIDLIRPVGDTAIQLVRLVFSGFETKSTEGFSSIPSIDDGLDKAMSENIKKMVDFVNENEGSADVCIYYISILKFLERVGDHACKMAEKVCFMVTGKRSTIR